MSPAQIFKRALAEKLAFTPMGADGPQAAGPGGAAMDPAAAGAAPPPGGDPAAAGMDPAAMGMDPAAAGGAPPAGMDPAAMDPAAAGGAPPADASGGMPPMPEPPPEAPPEEPPATDPANDGSLIDEQANAQQRLSGGDAMVPLSQLKEFTVGVIEATKGKKTQEAAVQEAKSEAAPAETPGPVTGMPGFDPSALGGPLKTATVLKFLLKR